MIDKALVEAVASEYLANTDLKLVKVKVSKDNDITIFIHRKGSAVCIDDCVALSEYIETEFDREKEDFSLTVSSAGMDYRDEDEDE